MKASVRRVSISEAGGFAGLILYLQHLVGLQLLGQMGLGLIRDVAVTVPSMRGVAVPVPSMRSHLGSIPTRLGTHETTSLSWYPASWRRFAVVVYSVLWRPDAKHRVKLAVMVYALGRPLPHPLPKKIQDGNHTKVSPLPVLDANKLLNPARP